MKASGVAALDACSVETMRDLDRKAVGDFGISEEILMENAGLAVCSVIAGEQRIPGRRFAVFCGGGNNGGDGLVVARKLHSMGAEVAVLLLSDAEAFRGPSRLNWEIIEKLGLPVKKLLRGNAARNPLERSDAVVDAIFGTGLTRNVEGIHREAVRMINGSGKPVFSVDIPSGINGDTGAVMGAAVKAAHTITFGLPKLGNLLYPGFHYCGKLHLSRISFPEALIRGSGSKTHVNAPAPLQERPQDAHKGTVGDFLVVAGASTYYGAPYFAAQSFLRAGGGYSRLAAPASIIPSIASKGSEIVFVPQRESSRGSLSGDNREGILLLSKQVDIVALGPGVSRDPETLLLIRELASAIEKPLIIDGDGIHAAADQPDVLIRRKQPTILTPHPGEAAALLNSSIKDILAHRIEAARRAAAEYRSVVVLKGAHSIIASPSSEAWINMSGNPGMATAGSGDVLTGTIAAMIGLGQDPEQAVKTGVFLHGLAGDLAARQMGEDGVTAGDIMEHLPHALRRYRRDYKAILESCYGTLFAV